MLERNDENAERNYKACTNAYETFAHGYRKFVLAKVLKRKKIFLNR